MRKFLLLFICLFSVCMLFACGKNEVDDVFKLLTAEDLKNHNGTIEISFTVPNGTIAANLEPLIADFERIWDGKIKVEFIKITGGYADLRKQTILDLNNTKATDMLIGYPDHFAEYYYGGGLLNLQPYIDHEGNNFIDDFVDAYMPENQISDENDDYYGLPLNKSTEVLIYNRTVFEALEYTVPTTWDEVEALCAQILIDVAAGKIDDTSITKLAATDTTPSKHLENGVFYPFAYDSGANAFITMTRQWGGAYTEKKDISQGYAVFDNANVKEGLSFFQEQAKKKHFAVAETFDKQYASDPFKTLQCLMTIGSSAGVHYNASEGADGFELGIAPIPYKTEDKKFVIQQGTNIAILSQNTNLERAACWQLIKYLTNTKNTVTFAINAGGYFPVRKSGYETTEYKDFLKGTEVMYQVVDKNGNPAFDENGDPVMSKNGRYYFSRSASVGLSYTQNDYTLFIDDFFNGSSKVRDEVGALFINVVVNNTVNIETAIKNTINTLGPKYKKK